MKITIEPTTEMTQKLLRQYGPSCVHPTITIDMPTDHLTLEEMLDGLIIPALKAVGYHQNSITQHIVTEVCQPEQ